MREVESKYAVQSVRSNDTQVWPLLRILYFFQARNLQNGASGTLGMDNTSRKLKRALWAFHGWSNWFKSCSYFVLSDSSENKVINGKLTNKLFHKLFTELGPKNILYCERPNPSHPDRRTTGNPNSVSASLVDIVASLLAAVSRIPDIQGKEVLMAIQKDYGLSINDEKALRLARAYAIVWNFLMAWKKPKALFLSDYYSLSHMAAIWTARNRQIPVVEFQHGVVNFEHPAYNFYTKGLSPVICPDYLFAFGATVKEEIGETCYIDPSHVKEVGHPYIHYMTTRPAVEGGERFRSSMYDRVVGATLQWTDEDFVIDFLSEAARILPRTLIVLIPRFPKLEKYSQLRLPENVRIEKDLDFYNCLRFVDIHCTTYSTCALEAPAFGVPNILIDTDGFATKYFGRPLSDLSYNRFVKTQAEFVMELEKGFDVSRQEVVTRSRHLFNWDYEGSLESALAEVLGVTFNGAPSDKRDQRASSPNNASSSTLSG